MLTGRTEEGKKKGCGYASSVWKGVVRNKRRSEGRWNNVDAVEE
jgi:hypothetical protein